MASIWKLPVVFVCENNEYGMSTSTERSTAVHEHRRPRRCVCDAGRHRRRQRSSRPSPTRSHEAVARARARRRPEPDRMQDLPPPRPLQERPQPLPHQGGDRRRGCHAIRSRASKRSCWHTASSTRRGIAAIREAAKQEIADAHRIRQERARSPIRSRCSTRLTSMPTSRPTDDDATRELSYAAGDPGGAWRIAMEADERVFLMGEDIGVYGGAFQVTGRSRRSASAPSASWIRRSPSSARAGVAVGAAMTGMRPMLRVPVLRFRHARHGADRQPGGEDALHARRRGLGAAGHAVSRRLRHRRRGAAQPEPRGLARPRARPEGGAARRRRTTPRACCSRRSTTPTR